MTDMLNFEVEATSAPPEEQRIMEEGKQEQKQTDAQVQGQAQAPQAQGAGGQSGSMGVFSTLALTTLFGLNSAIGGEAPHIEHVRFEVGKDVDETIVNDIIATGDRLDKKYLKEFGFPDEARLPFMFGLYLMVHGRLGALADWVKKRQETRKKSE